MYNDSFEAKNGKKMRIVEHALDCERSIKKRKGSWEIRRKDKLEQGN